MFIHQLMNSFFIYQCTDYKLNVVAFISEVLYVYYVIDNNNKEVVSMETPVPIFDHAPAVVFKCATRPYKHFQCPALCIAFVQCL